MTKEQQQIFEKEIENFLNDLGIKAQITFNFNESDKIINIQLDSAEAALLIGFHGETLQALQLIFTFLAHKIFREWIRVRLNVGDYQQKREEQLKKLALNLALKVKASGETQTIANLSPAERRIVHLVLSDHPEVTTESEGEGKNRVLIIKPRNIPLSKDYQKV